MNLADALGLGERELVAFVGAGGKKTAMSALVEVGEENGHAVGYTTTTHMPPPSTLPVEIGEIADRQRDLSLAFGSEWVESPQRASEKLRGYESSTVDNLFLQDAFEWLLVKADGARRRGFKAPGDHEPVLPSRTTTAVVVASVQTVGKPLAESVVHRPERVGALTGLGIGDEITPETISTVLAHPEGGLKNVPEMSSVYVVLNKSDTPEQRAIAREVLEDISSRSGRFAGGLVTSFRENVCIPVEFRN